MSSEKLYVEVITPEKKMVFDQVDAFFAPGALGGFEVLPGHDAMVTQIEIGVVKVQNNGQTPSLLSVSNGFCEISRNEIRLMVESAEKAEEIDMERALKAKERAEKRLKQKQEGVDYDRARMALARSLNRLRLKK